MDATSSMEICVFSFTLQDVETWNEMLVIKYGGCIVSCVIH